MHWVTQLTREVDRLGSTAARLKLKGIDGDPHKRWMMWINSMQREEPYLVLACTEFFRDKKLHEVRIIIKYIKNIFINFIDNPRKDLSSKYLCTNIPNNEEINTTNKQKKQILKS